MCRDDVAFWRVYGVWFRSITLVAYVKQTGCLNFQSISGTIKEKIGN